MNKFSIECTGCNGITSKSYARQHNGLCKRCSEPRACLTRDERIQEHGYDAYAREEGHYDEPDSYHG